jgi:hypothetical protein
MIWAMPELAKPVHEHMELVARGREEGMGAIALTACGHMVVGLEVTDCRPGHRRAIRRWRGVRRNIVTRCKDWDRTSCRRNIQIGTDHQRNSESRSQCTVEVISETIAQIICDYLSSGAEKLQMLSKQPFS